MKFSIVHMDFFYFFLFFCWSPLSVVLTVSRGQQAKRRRFDAYLLAATSDITLVQLYVRVVSSWGKMQSIRKSCSSLVKLSKTFCLPVCHQKYFLPAWCVTFFQSAKTSRYNLHKYNHHAYVIYLQFSF